MSLAPDESSITHSILSEADNPSRTSAIPSHDDGMSKPAFAVETSAFSRDLATAPKRSSLLLGWHVLETRPGNREAHLGLAGRLVDVDRAELLAFLHDDLLDRRRAP